jgi:hypothetical protein
MRVLFIVEYDIFGLGYLLCPKVLIYHLLVEAKWHTDKELTQFTHLVDSVFFNYKENTHICRLESEETGVFERLCKLDFTLY